LACHLDVAEEKGIEDLRGVGVLESSVYTVLTTLGLDVVESSMIRLILHTLGLDTLAKQILAIRKCRQIASMPTFSTTILVVEAYDVLQ
jgi:hypothetical protein